MRKELSAIARQLRDGRQEIVDDLLATFRAVPGDAIRECRCDEPPVYGLPDWLAEQCQPVPAP
jgi:hypothetical protein